MYAPYGPFFAIIPELVPRNVTAEVVAMINSAGALGGFVGAWLVGEFQARTGNSRAGYLLMSVSLIASGLIMFFGLGRNDAPGVVVAGSWEDAVAARLETSEI